MVALVVLALAIGAGFGAATSLLNSVSSVYGIGSRLVDTHWVWVVGVASVASKLFDAGWAWAALAVAAGWLAGNGPRGTLAGMLALLAATAAYFGMDAVLRDNSLAWFWDA